MIHHSSGNMGSGARRSASEALWRLFNDRADEDHGHAPGSYEGNLLSEWERCREMEVDPSDRRFPILDRETFAHHLEMRRPLANLMHPLMESAGNIISTLPGILLFADGGGTVLKVAGAPRQLELAADKSNLVEGGILKEEVVGNNGVGTAISRKAPVHITFSEHYHLAGHCWDCFGAPIVDPLTEEIVGVFNFSAYKENIPGPVMALIGTLAERASAELAVLRGVEQILLTDSFAEYESRYPSESLVAINRAGKVVRFRNVPDMEKDGGASLLTRFEDARELEVHRVYLEGTDEPIGVVVVNKR